MSKVSGRCRPRAPSPHRADARCGALPHTSTACAVGGAASGLRPSRSPPRGRLPPWNPRSRCPPQSACHCCMPLGAESGRCVPHPRPAAGHSISRPTRFASSPSLLRAFVSRLPLRFFAPSFRVIRSVSRHSRSKRPPARHRPRGRVGAPSPQEAASPTAGGAGPVVALACGAPTFLAVDGGDSPVVHFAAGARAPVFICW